MKPGVSAIYQVEGKDYHAIAHAIAIGQSTGNPHWQSEAERNGSVKKFEARVEWVKPPHVKIRWPVWNFGRADGINHMMSVLLGGQCDIGYIRSCRLVKLDMEVLRWKYPGPNFGIEGVRKLLGVYGRPLLGGIVKPKLGISAKEVGEVCRRMADGGVDFIKEDEVIPDRYGALLKDRVKAVAKALKGYNVLYAPSITDDGGRVLKRAKQAVKYGATAIHANIWCGLGVHRELVKYGKVPVFFQKSGDRVWTTGPYSISSPVLYQLVRMAGCDFAHIGMYGGYLSESLGVIKERMQMLEPGIPSFSCGMEPGLVFTIISNFGKNLMLTCGGYLHSHKDGPTKAAREMRRAIDASC